MIIKKAPKNCWMDLPSADVNKLAPTSLHPKEQALIQKNYLSKNRNLSNVS